MHRFPLTAAAIAAASVLAATPAHADIYTFIDKAGILNLSNVAPPKDARIVNVTRSDPAANARAMAAQAAARDATDQREMLELRERVAELERSTDNARSMPLPMQLVVAPPPPAPIVIALAPPPAPEPVDAPFGCAWVGCPLWFGGVPAFVSTAPGFRHHHRGMNRPRPIRPAPNPAGPTPRPMVRAR